MAGLLEQWTAAPPRVEQAELLELGEGTATEVRENLHDMHRANRWLGGHAALRRFLLPRVRRAAGGAPLRVLDVASGAGHTPLMLAEWARRQRIALRIVALDASHRLLGVARQQHENYPEVSRLLADARDLPLAPASFDFVISTQFLHHLSPAELTATLRALAKVCRGPIILNDLVRSPASAFVFRYGARLFSQNRLTLHDGLASIRQAYTPPELREILHAADLPRARIHTHGLYYRMTVVIDPDAERPAH
jgi:2-polyprenyl-3-methyl-5-hydroxy-6-metoxy-1,4-benzoquinol methylase